MFRVPILLLALILLAWPAAAQDDDPETNCVESDPCPWLFDVDEDGVDDGSFEGASFNATQGDWIRLEVFNFDEVPHSLVFEGMDLSWEVASYEELRTEPVFLDQAGTFRIVDENTGDEVPVNVFVNDATAVDEGEEDPDLDPETPEDDAPDDGGADDSADGPSDDRGTPGPAVGALVAAMGLVLLMRRRS